MKVIKTQVLVRKYGMASQIGKLIYSSIISKEYRKYWINTTKGWKSKFNRTG